MPRRLMQDKSGPEKIKSHSVFKNPAFWSVVIAAIAVVLSQSPHMDTWFKGKKLKADVSPIVHFSHHMGLTTLVLSISLQNIGSTDLLISEIKGAIFTPQSSIIPLSAEVLIKSISDISSGGPHIIPIGAIPLKLGEYWSGVVRFREYTSERIMTIQNSIMSKTEDNLKEKSVYGKNNQGDKIKVDPEILKEAIAFFENAFKLRVGKHQLVFLFKSNNGEVLKEVAYEFNLDKYHLDIAIKATEDYVFGWGICLLPPYSRNISSYLKRLDDKATEYFSEKYKKLNDSSANEISSKER